MFFPILTSVFPLDIDLFSFFSAILWSNGWQLTVEWQLVHILK